MLHEPLWLWGAHAVYYALENPQRQKICLYLTPSAETRLNQRQKGDLWEEGPFKRVSKEELTALLPQGALHQGIALQVSPLQGVALKTLLTPKGARILLAAENITDPQNIGALFRTACALGVDGLIFEKKHLPLLSGALAKVAAGALDLLPFCVVGNLKEAVKEVQKHDFWCWGLAEEGEPFQTHTPHARTLLVLGAEGRGLSMLLKKRLDGVLALPTNPSFPTLNVHVAGAVALVLLQNKN